MANLKPGYTYTQAAALINTAKERLLGK
jgi:hypothetical protein